MYLEGNKTMGSVIGYIIGYVLGLLICLVIHYWNKLNKK